MPTSHRSRASAWFSPASLFVALILALPASGQALAQAKPAPLSLAEAIVRSNSADPTQAGARFRLAAAEAGVRQAEVRLNPSLDVELENFTGSGPYASLGRSEATASYAQTFERGGKRAARSGLARAELELVLLRETVRRLDLAQAVQVAYGGALSADAELLIAEARLIAADRAEADIARRVKSARDPLFAGARAQTLTAQAQIDRDQAQAAAHAARAELARFWGGAADFSLDPEAFYRVTSPSGASVEENADLVLLAATRDAAEARLRVERARQVADPTLRAGVRYFGDGSDVAVLVGGSIPLQRYDANKAGIERALAERNAAEGDLAAARISRTREIARLLARLSAAAETSERIRTEVIPSAIRTVELVRDGFNRGGFQYLDVTEAERALAAARERRVVVLRQFHIDQAALDRLTGRHLGLVQTQIAEIR